jgi:hypothetical protein
MLAWFSELFSRKGGVKTATHDSFASGFVLLDPSRVAQEFSILKLARENAAKEIPHSDASTSDHVEEGLKAHLRGLETDQGTVFARRLRSLKQALGNLTSDLDFHALAAQVNHVCQRAAGEVERGRAAFFGMRNQFVNLTNELNDFRRDNALTRIEPRNQGGQIFKVGLILFLLAVETVINANFFAPATQQGLIGGAVMALAVSVVNLGVSFYIGWKGIPLKNCVDKQQRFLGRASFVFWFLFILLVNLVAGHYREVLLLSVDDPLVSPGVAALSAFSTSPFGIADLTSWYLVLIGCFAATLAVVDGYNYDDPYPGYGDLWRRHHALTQEMSNEIEDQHDDLEEHFSELNSEFQQRLSSLGSRKQKFDVYCQQINNLKAEFKAFQSQLSSVFSTVINQYRSENAANRQTSPPQYFNEPPVFEPTFLLATEDDPAFVLGVQEAIDQGGKQLPKLIKEIQSNHESLRARLPNFEALHRDPEPQTIS